MIQVAHLRIGNWVRFYEADPGSDCEGFVKVIRIEEGEFYAESDYVHPNPRTVVYEPIPLSPDILEKCGFAEEQNGFQTKFGKTYRSGLVDTRFEITYLDEETYAFIEGNIITHLSYLHQLQNLYFALTQTELTLNL